MLRCGIDVNDGSFAARRAAAGEIAMNARSRRTILVRVDRLKVNRR
jgi:hypothetical protein